MFCECSVVTTEHTPNSEPVSHTLCPCQTGSVTSEHSPSSEPGSHTLCPCQTGSVTTQHSPSSEPASHTLCPCQTGSVTTQHSPSSEPASHTLPLSDRQRDHRTFTKFRTSQSHTLPLSDRQRDAHNICCAPRACPCTAGQPQASGLASSQRLRWRGSISAPGQPAMHGGLRAQNLSFHLCDRQELVSGCIEPSQTHRARSTRRRRRM